VGIKGDEAVFFLPEEQHESEAKLKDKCGTIQAWRVPISFQSFPNRNTKAGGDGSARVPEIRITPARSRNKGRVEQGYRNWFRGGGIGIDNSMLGTVIVHVL
jgi:hypothetical protein